MKKNIGLVAAAVLAAAALAACGGQKTETTAAETTAAESGAETTAESGEATESAADAELEKLTVGASPAPHAEILEAAKEAMAAKGYELDIVEYVDYVQPNLALESGDLDANYFQHITYLEDFNAERGTHLGNGGAIHYEPFGIYAGKTATLEELADGAQVAVPNDATNEARALLLLEAQGLIKLKEGAGLAATKNDIEENTKNLEIVEIEAAQIPRSLESVDVAVINGNYAIDAGLSVSDALAVEASDSEAAEKYANVIAVQEGHENDPAIQALVEVLKSDEIKTFIDTTYGGAVVPLD